ncbi:leukocidin family pore-forming toxin [Pigmentibacter sp. JX0631]|uniref:leukocidin family pore-forming toxin n=1 Tax=Pigmentibacter sp. JX0631 TaxID=2976982 RepID=UPI00246978A2|nr:leukocidin family pore-forming toxin [Pigmentibacter sp. JX0631]WGL59985.1 leukocidin family pore-forming toxin [Pigmentibacter sp. JX0631]
MQKNKVTLYSLSSILILFLISCGKKDNTHSETTTEYTYPGLVVLKEENNKHNYLNDYENYTPLYLEKNSDKTKKLASNVIKEISGLSFASNYVLVAKTNNGPKFYVYNEKPSNEMLNKHLELLVSDKDFQNKNIKNVKSTLTNATVNITLVRRNIQCPMLMFFDEEELKDYCINNAFLELNYKVDLSGSKITMKEDPKTGQLIKTENAKYLMVSVSPDEEGGTGWHLADDINQGFNRSEFLRSKRDFVGPYANKYNFWVNEITSTNDVKLVKTFPQNTNPGSTVTQSHGTTIGLSGNIVGGVMNHNPNANVSLGASIQISNLRNVSYNTYEYTIENISYNNKAKWMWDSKVNDKICDYLTRKDFNTCHFTEAAWQKSWSANRGKFSAISHKSFTPSFQAVFKTSKQNQGNSIFELGTNVEAGVILGRKLSFALFHYINIKTNNFTTPNITEQISVDWSSPYFASELNFRLQNTKELYSSKCLLVDNNKNVVHSECVNSRAQVWGYDNDEKQFKTRLFNESCLNLDQMGYLTVNTCNINFNQKWVLNDQGHIQLSSDKSKVIGLDSFNKVRIVDINSDKKIHLEAYSAVL